MSDKDLAVGAVGSGQLGVPSGAIYAGGLNVGNSSVKKPHYLVTLEVIVKNKVVNKLFIAVDRPDITNGFVQVRGIYSDLSEDEIVANYANIVAAVPKEQQLEVMFPAQKISSIRSLVFNALKPTMVGR
jgi:hypothetical protein